MAKYLKPEQEIKSSNRKLRKLGTKGMMLLEVGSDIEFGNMCILTKVGWAINLDDCFSYTFYTMKNFRAVMPRTTLYFTMTFTENPG